MPSGLDSRRAWRSASFSTGCPGLSSRSRRDTFRLGCTPIVNLFEQIAEPIRLNHAQTEYRVIPDVRRQNATEVYAIDAVISTSPHLARASSTFAALLLVKACRGPRAAAGLLVCHPQAIARKGDAGTEVYLSLVNLNFQPTLPALSKHSWSIPRAPTATCRAKLPFGGESGDFELEGAAPLSRIRCLKKPTRDHPPAATSEGPSGV